MYRPAARCGAIGTSGVGAVIVEGEVLMAVDPDDLISVVRYALESTRAVALCPFHLDVTVRVGDDAAETHALARARNITKSDGTR